MILATLWGLVEIIVAGIAGAWAIHGGAEGSIPAQHRRERTVELGQHARPIGVLARRTTHAHDIAAR